MKLRRFSSIEHGLCACGSNLPLCFPSPFSIFVWEEPRGSPSPTLLSITVCAISISKHNWMQGQIWGSGGGTRTPGQVPSEQRVDVMQLRCWSTNMPLPKSRVCTPNPLLSSPQPTNPVTSLQNLPFLLIFSNL